MAGRAGRRTRVYNASYNIGENYYKSALDSIDRKYSGASAGVERRDVSAAALPPAPAPRQRVNFDENDNDGLYTARRRAERAITEDTFFDSKGSRVTKSKKVNPYAELDDEIEKSIDRIRSNRKALADDDDELDKQIEAVKRRARVDLGENLDAGDSGAFKATFKVTTRRQVQEAEPASLTKWSKVSQHDEDRHSSSAASVRALASKTRLSELDSEMYERNEKQLAREKRSAQLKQFLSDSDIETVRADRR